MKGLAHKPSPRPVVKKPNDVISLSERDSRVAELSGMEMKDLKRLAGVKKKGFFSKLFTTASNWLNGVNLALAIGPTVGHLILAKEFSKLKHRMTGEPQQAPMDWLRENRPQGFSDSIGSVMVTGSAPLKSNLGLSLSDLTEVEEHYYRVLAPTTNENGVKSTAPFLREMAKESSRAPGQSRPAFVFLGKKRTGEAESITKLWNSPDKPPQNPFGPLDPRRRIWTALESQAKKDKLPIFVDIDGDYNTFTGTEFVAKKTLSSLGERNNSLGDDFADTSRYFAWLTQRQESYSRDLQPYLEKQQPQASKLVQGIKNELTPPWLDGAHGMGPWTAPERMRELPQRLQSIKSEFGENSWTDSLISLDRDTLTGVQSYWIKLLRESTRENRALVLEQIPETFFSINLLLPGEKGFSEVAPSDAPGLGELIPQDKMQVRERPYDRSVGLKELLDHTLDGLGIAERRSALKNIKKLADGNSAKLNLRELRLRKEMGDAYDGIDVQKVLKGEISQAKFDKGIAQLTAWSDQRLRTPEGQEARRHASMLEFLHNMDTRYGEVDKILPRIKGDFTSNPLGVSEYFIAPETGAKVTPLREIKQSSVRMGNNQDPNPTKMSLVLEGGGGRGFAYVECLKQLEGSFIQSENGYEVDEYIGTSAGSIVSVLLAAGFKADELREVMDTIDFSSFNADAAWLMGGVDPKVRGIERNGLFSTQKMYQTFHELLAKKLGIEGRPVLFSDLPHKLKLVTTLMNTDLSDDHPLRDSLDADGRFTMSTGSTPNFDVVGALISSSAVPAFFQLPQILVARPGADGETERGRMQFGDGGVVDNMSISSASRKEKAQSLVVLPAHTQTRDPQTGEWVGLDTLNFSTDNLDLVDAHNKKLYKNFAPKLDEYFQRLKGHGVERAVIAFNLVKPWQQKAPALQGSSEEIALHSLIHAKDIGMPTVSKAKGDSLIEFSQRPPHLLTNVLGDLFDRYIDDRPSRGDGTGDFHRDQDGFHYHPAKTEANDFFEMGWACGGAALAASKSEYAERRFQRNIKS